MVTKATKKSKAVKKRIKRPVAHRATEEQVKGEARPPSTSPTKHDYLAAVGRRKEAVARVRLFTGGKGNITINSRSLIQYFTHFDNQFTVLQPLKLLGVVDKVDVQIKVTGGGKVGQAEAIRHGLSRVLLQVDPNHRQTLKPHGLLTRDSRVKERKKPGFKKARRAPQFSKR